MCGRASLTKTEKELEKRFGATFYREDVERYNPLPNYNVAPTNYLPVITNRDPQHLQCFRWGLVPFWAKDERVGNRMINARAETLENKPAFRKALLERRCLVPLDGFYEWIKAPSGTKVPYRITLREGALFCVAGLWETWQSPAGPILHSFTLITVPPNALLARIHDRMPAILLPEDEQSWLKDDLSPDELLRLLEPYPEDRMEAWPVSSRVNKVSENDAELIRPTGASLSHEPPRDLFS